MKIKSLVKKLARPVDSIAIDIEGDSYTVFGGPETNHIPDELLNLNVKTWDVRAAIYKVSSGESKVMYLLEIIT